MRRGLASLTAAALIAAVGAAAAQDGARSSAEPEDVSVVLAKIREAHALPALGGAIVTSGGLVAIGADGTRVAGEDAPVTTDDLWHLGSCTKAMTATLLGRLQEKKRLLLSTELSQAFPELEIDEAWRDVPLAWLLRNRGGAPADLRANGLWGRLWRFDGAARDARRLLTSEVLAGPPAYEPSTKYTYSNAGFAIAGHAAETREDAAWEDLLREHLFVPLGMEGAGFGAPGDATQKDQPFGHRPRDGGPDPVAPGPAADNPPAIGPAGTVHASLADWGRFVRLHLRGARGEKGLLLRPETFTTLHTAAEGETYAMGWSTATRPWAKGDEGSGRVLTHAGSNTMWYCVTWVAPERDFAVLVTCNLGGGGAARACDTAAAALIRHHLGNE